MIRRNLWELEVKKSYRFRKEVDSVSIFPPFFPTGYYKHFTVVWVGQGTEER